MINTDRLCPGCMKDNSGEQICSVCGYDAAKGNAPDKLPVKFIIRDRYFVGKTLYSDAEITIYLGFDCIENKPVNIKEYFPAEFAQRNPDKTVSVRREAQFAFNQGLLDFIQNNKKLIGFPLQSLPSTYAVFEENSTAYAVCDTVSGITLESFLTRNGGMLKWEQVRPLFLPLIDTLKALHDMSLIHGGISPESVIVCRDGKLRLLSVPANSKKRVQGGDSPALTPVLYDGYSALEQYGASYGETGEFTDVYGVCATLLTAITGIVPPDAQSRLKDDTLKIPAHFADELPRQVLVALANGMQVKPDGRTRDIETLKNELIYGETKENLRKVQRSAQSEQVKTAKSNKEPEKKGSSFKYAAIASGITAGLFIIAAVVLMLTVFKDQIFKKAENTSSNDIVSMPSKQSIGDYDSNAIESKILYTVPDLRGKYYAEVEGSEECDHFKLVIKGKDYSSTYQKGQICAQSIAGGESAAHETVIELTISLGPKEVKMPNVTGMTADQAKIELLKTGLLYENIEIVDEYDADSKPGTVLRQYPDRGQTINTEIAVRVYVNSYTGEESGGTNYYY